MAGFRDTSQTVVAPDQRVWTIRRALLPRPPHWRGWKPPESRDEEPVPSWAVPPARKRRREPGDGSGWSDAAWFAGDMATPLTDLGAWLFVVAVVGIVLLLAWFLVFPVLVFVVDLLIFLLIAAGGIALRVLFRRPWKVTATTKGPPPEEIVWGVVGVRASADAVDTVAKAISRGTPPGEIHLAR